MDSIEISADKTSLLENLAAGIVGGNHRNELNPTDETPYGVHIGMDFNNQYDPSTWAAGYPHLFPYGAGAPGSIQGISLIEYF